MIDPSMLTPAVAVAAYAYYVLGCVASFMLFGTASLFLKGARAARAHDLARRALSAAWPLSWPRRPHAGGTPSSTRREP